jgi:hypothetical protein
MEKSINSRYHRHSFVSQKRKKMDLNNIDYTKEFNVLSKEGLVVPLTGNWGIVEPFGVDDFGKVKCTISPQDQLIDKLAELKQQALEKYGTEGVVYKEPLWKNTIRVGLESKNNIPKMMRVKHRKGNGSDLVEWDKLRNIDASRGSLKINFYSRQLNEDGGVQVGMFFQLTELQL